MMRIVCTAALALSGCVHTPPALPVTLTFPDFPENVVAVELGQSVTIDVRAQNDDGEGVTWTCAGDGCAPLITTPVSVTFKASGKTGKALITATSRKQPDVQKHITVSVGLNESPDMLCK